MYDALTSAIRLGKTKNTLEHTGVQPLYADRLVSGNLKISLIEVFRRYTKYKYDKPCIELKQRINQRQQGSPFDATTRGF